MVLKNVIVVLLLLALIGFAGCVRTITLHPIENDDILMVQKDEILLVPKDGVFMSDFYLSEIAQIKVAG